MTTNNLTEQYKTRTLPNDFYYFDNGKNQYIVEYHNIKGFEGLDGVKVLAEVPSYEKWQPFTDPYFKGLTTKDIAELAKKSIRLTTQHCEDNERIKKLEELLKNVTDECDIEKQKALLKINQLAKLLKEAREKFENLDYAKGLIRRIDEVLK